MQTNKNKPQEIYQNLMSEIEQLEFISNQKNEDEEIEEVRQNAVESLIVIKKTIEENIIALEKNSEWDTFVIAFYGETGAGKSTIIETLRILMNEPKKVSTRAKFSRSQTPLENLESDLQKSQDAEQEITNELMTLEEELENLQKSWIEEAKKQENFQLLGQEKAFDGLKNMFLFLFNRIEELKEAQALLPQVEQQAEEVDRKTKEVEIKYSEKKENQSKIEGMENKKTDLLQDLEKYSDGQIIGDGSSDFTQEVGEYLFEVDGKKFEILDLPGILGNEKVVQTAIDEGVEKAHVVFYVSKHPNPPQKGDEKSLGAIEKISQELSKHSEIYFLYNKPISSPQALKESLINEEDKKSLILVDDTLSAEFPDVYVKHKNVGAYPAFVTLGNFSDEKKLKSKNKFIEKFSDTKKVLELSGIQEFCDWLTTDLVDNAKNKIKQSNIKKVTAVLTETSDVVLSLSQNFSELFEKNHAQLELANGQLDQIEKSFNQKIDNAINRAKRKFETNVRQKLYDKIENEIESKKLKWEFEQAAKREISANQKLGETNSDEFEQEVKNVVLQFNKYLQENIGKASGKSNKINFSSTDVNEFDNSKAIVKAGVGLLASIGGVIVGIVTIPEGGVGVPILVVSIAGMAASLIKGLNDFRLAIFPTKANKRKWVDANLKMVSKNNDFEMKKQSEKTKKEAAKYIMGLKKQLEKSTNPIKKLAESYKSAFAQLLELRNQIENGEI